MPTYEVKVWLRHMKNAPEAVSLNDSLVSEGLANVQSFLTDATETAQGKSLGSHTMETRDGKLYLTTDADLGSPASLTMLDPIHAEYRDTKVPNWTLVLVKETTGARRRRKTRASRRRRSTRRRLSSK
jgi:hypothetical protein